MDTVKPNYEHIVARLRDEFLADARERLDRILDLVMWDSDNQPLAEIYREIHNLKGCGASFGFPSITLLAHRLEDYISGLSQLDTDGILAIEAFVDSLSDIVNAGREPDPDALSGLLRRLPASGQPDFADIPTKDIEVLLVTPGGAVRKAIARELLSCGYRVTTVDSPWRAFEMAICIRPDLIVTSMVLDRLSGVDLTRALAAMDPTALIPVIVMTSLAVDHPDLERLGPETPVIRFSENLRNDLVDALAHLAIA